MAFLPPAIFEIKAVADKAIAEFKQVNNELGKMEDKSLKAGGSIAGIDKASRIATAGLLAMGAAFAGFAALGIKEAMDAEVIMTKLNATLAAQGLNTAATRKEIDELSSSFVKLGFDDEEAASSMQVLIQSTGDLAKSKELLAMSADLARAKTISLEAASQMLVRANMGAGKVFKQFGIELDTTLPKAEATSKAMQELKEKLSGQAQKATETLAVQMQILKERFNNAAQAVGTVLIPYLKSLFEKINQGIEFVKRNSTAFQIFGGIVLTVTVALASYALTLKVITAATKTYAFVQGVAKTATALLTGQQIALNGAMAINPIGLVVMAVVALIGVLVILWNKSDTFRKGVIAMAKAALYGFASIIPMIGQVGEAYLKFLLTPMKLFLTALSHLPGVGKYAKSGLDILNKGLDGVSDFADKAAAKAKNLADGLDRFNKPIKIKLLETPEVDFGNKVVKNGKGGKGLTPEQKKAQEEVTKANEGYMKIVKDLNDKVISAKETFDDKMQSLQTDYDEKVFKLNEDAAEKIAKLRSDANKKIAEAQKRFNDSMGDLNKKHSEDLAKATLDNQNKIAEITKSGQERLQSIIQQSIDRLRNAFSQGTSFNVGDIFKGLSEAGSASADNLLKSLQDKLAGAKELAANAARLQAMGFSQTFIEQVVSQGPEVGNKLAESLKNATPETIKQLQTTYADLENTSNTALNGLASVMSSNGTLATDELKSAYIQAQNDLKEALVEQSKKFAEIQVEINKNFSESMTELEKTRDEAIASIRQDLAESIEEVNKDLAKALKESFDEFVKAQDNAKKQLSDALKSIEKDFKDKLGNINNYIASTTAAMQQLLALMASMSSYGSSYVTPVNTGSGGSNGSIIPIPLAKPTTPPVGGVTPAVYITQNITNTTPDANATLNATVSAIKNGMPNYVGSNITVPAGRGF